MLLCFYNIIVPSAMLCCVQNWRKMIPKSFQKQLSNQHQTWIDFAPNLAPFWEVFGGQDGAKFAPRCLQDAIFFSFFFWHRFLSIFIPTWSQLGPNLAPKSTPKPNQEPSKIDPKSHLIFDLFFDRFLIDFPSIFGAKINQKSIKNKPQNHPKSTSTKNWKHRFLSRHGFFPCVY